MNPQEIKAQIVKFKARRLKARLANYSLFTSILLSLSIFTRGVNSSSLVSFLIILPLPLYFALQSLKLASKTRTLKERISTLESHITQLESRFSFIKFLTQPGFTFRLSLILFFLVCLTTFARVRATNTNPSISYNVSVNK
jgi:hypothetical protein